MSIEPSPEGPIFATRDTDPVIVASHEVRRERTPLTDAEIRTTLAAGHALAFGVEASPERMSVAWAMVCQETARGKALWNWNMGNVDATSEWRGDRFALTADEGYGTSRRGQTKFLRAFPDALTGTVAWWRFMAEGYPAVLARFDAGDGNGAGLELKKAMYFTGDVVAYCRALRLMSAEFLRRWHGGDP